MKVFNKDKALRQIKLKQNKNTYIKKVSIVLSCFILIIGIMYFTFAKFEQNSEEYTLINGVVKYGGSGDIILSYVVDGVSQSIPPAKGTGYIVKSVDCTNGEGSWLYDEWGVKVVNIIGKAKCNIEFEEAQYNNVTKWLATANINKNYTTLNEVFDDTNTLNTLISNQLSCDYLKNSTEWINDVISNENAMTYIGNNDYCADILYFENDWNDGIVDSTYWDKVLYPLVPVMTSNTVPDGYVVSCDSNLGNHQPPYTVFKSKTENGDWYSANNANHHWIKIQLPEPVLAKYVVLKVATWGAKVSIQGSNDDNNWNDFVTGISDWYGSNGLHEYNLKVNNTAYKYYRIYTTEQGSYLGCSLFNIYGRK